MTGATILLVMAILAIYTMRKRKMTFRQAIEYGKNRMVRSKRSRSPPTPPKTEAWDHKAAYDADFGAVVKNPMLSPELPKKALSLHGSDSGSSRKLFVTLQRKDRYVYTLNAA